MAVMRKFEAVSYICPVVKTCSGNDAYK